MLDKNAVQNLDWLSLVEERLAYDWLNAVLDGERAFLQLQASGAAEDQLWQLYLGHRMGVRLYGTSPLYFTYPHFYTGDVLGEADFPLLRWPCMLQPPRPGNTYWELTVEAEAPTEINGNWLKWASNIVPEIDWSQKLSAVAGTNDKHLAIRQFAESLAKISIWQVSTLQPALVNDRNAQLFKAEMSEGGLLWTAQLRLDNTVWASVSDQRESQTETIQWQSRAIHQWTPVQQELVDAMEEKEQLLWVTDANETSQHQHIVQLIESARLQGLSCLIVAQDRHTLDQLATDFQQHGLQDEVFLWQNEAVDRPLWTAKVVAFEKQISTPSPFELAEWQAVQGRLDRQQRQLVGALLETRRRIFNKDRWADVLGHYLRSSRTQAKALLASQLNSASFAFTASEYDNIQNSIDKTWKIWQQLPDHQPPASDLNAAIFVHQTEVEAAAFIRNTAQRLLEKALPLHQTYVKQQNDYADALQTYYQRYYLLLREGLEKVKASLQDLRTRHGDDIIRSRDTTLSLYGTFSSKFKIAKQQRAALKQQLTQLETTHLQRNEFEANWPTGQSHEWLSTLPEFLSSYEMGLENWLASLGQHVQDETLRLNYKTALDDLSASTGIQALEERLEDFIDEVNAVGLYQLPLKSKHLTLLKQQRYLEEIIEKLERSRQFQDHFSIFYAWQKNWFSLAENARKVIQALMRTRATEWQNAFASWYFNELLTAAHRPQLGNAFRNETADSKERDQHLTQLARVIRTQSYPAQKVAAKDLKATVTQADFSLGSLSSPAGQAMATLAPITLATPSIGLQLASFFQLGVAVQAQRHGVDTISACQQRVLTTSKLTREYVLQTNKAFQHTAVNLVEDVEAIAANDVLFFQRKLEDVQGRYDEESCINTAEALAVLDWLNKLEVGSGKRLPKVLILCFSIKQRNHLLQQLYQIKKTGDAAAEHILQLERNGLQVLSLADWVGQTCDYLAVSVTYGIVNKKIGLSQHIEELQDPLRAAAIQQLLTFNGENLTVFHSIPNSFWETEGAKETLINQQLSQLIKKKTGKTEHASSPSADPLTKELIFRLGALATEWSLEPIVPFGPSHPILRGVGPGQQEVAILYDGFVSQQNSTNWSWEVEQRSKLQMMGMECLHLDLEKLWRNPSTTLHQLSRQLDGLKAKS